METVQSLIPAFEAHMRRRGRVESTIVVYHRPLVAFGDWAGERDVDSFEPRDIEAFLDHDGAAFFERNGRSPAANTLRKTIQGLANFFAWAVKFDYVTKDPMRRIEPPPVFAARTTGSVRTRTPGS